MHLCKFCRSSDLLDFSQLCCKKLEYLGDFAANTQRYDMTVSHYTTALSLDPPSPEGILLKRKKAFGATESYKQALDFADQVHHFILVRVSLVHAPSYR